MTPLTMNNKPEINVHLQQLALLKPYIGRLVLAFMIMLVTVIIQLAYPKAIAYFIDNSVLEKEGSWLTWVASIMLVVFVIQAIATAMRYYLFETTGTMIVSRLRQKLYNAIICKEIGFFDKNNVGDLTNRLSSDVEVMQSTLTMGLAVALRSLFTCIGGTVLLLILSPALSLLLLIVIPAFMISSRWVGKRIGIKSKVIQQKLAHCNQIAHEHFSNIRLVHAFTQQGEARKKYNDATYSAQETSISTTRLLAGFQGAGSFIQYFALLITLWFGGKLVANQAMSIGGLMSFILYASMVVSSASVVSSFWGEWMKSIGASERVFELLHHLPQTGTGNDIAIAIDHFNGEITFDNVSFSYPSRSEQVVLKSLNLTITSGERVAFVGPSGAGKSTIANLILGFYPATSGQLKFDDISAEQLNLTAIRQNIAIVEQEPTLFSGSILENMRYARSDKYITDEEIFDAAKHANAHDFISRFPQGYNTLLGDRGIQLSGGQKQRIAIARAILRNPKILILDEATSALDSESEHQVQTALDHLMEGRTTIMIAHRFSTIAKADRLIVMDQGKIVQNGVHQQLMEETNNLYFQLVEKQLAYSKSA